jgi:RsiW-degrading membrane proteinase PrsW (M82 family)
VHRWPRHVRLALLARLSFLGPLVTLAFLAFILSGCGARDTVGLSDVEVRFEPADPSEKITPAVVAAVNSRLGAAHVTSDVSMLDDHTVSVTVDSALLQTTTDMLAWNGGVSAYEPDDAFPLSLPGLTKKGAFYTGTRADLSKEIASAKLPDDRRALYRSQGGGIYLLRIARKEPAFVVWAAKLDDRAEGGALVITPGSPPEHLPTGDRTTFLFALGSTVLGDGPAPLPDSPLVLHFGKDFASYTVAHETKRVLGGPKFPVMKRVQDSRLPRNWPLFLSCIVLPFAVSVGWLWFIRRFDRAHPEPMRTIVITFVMGNLSVVPAGFAEKYISLATPYLDPQLSTMGGRWLALPLALLVFTVTVGCVEEGVKLLASVFAFKRKEFDEPVDGIVYGVTASLGFAAAENLRYFAMGRLAAPLVCARAFMTVPAHMFFGALWGYGFGEALHRKKPRRLLFFGLAALSHGAYDALLSTDGGGWVATAIVLGLATVFVMLLQRSLRFGILNQTPLEGRRFFPVGNKVIFGAAVVGLHVSAFILFLLGAVLQYNKHHVSVVFILVSAGLLATFGMLLDVIARTLPLDAVTDARGVTFSGTTRDWHTIAGARLVPGALIVQSSAGDLRIGPGRPQILSALAHEIDANLLTRS